ncbi:MAG: hypothetical protein ACI9KE_004425 [Polyangiales bacterium]|jgi:hypothetical protein
MLKALEGLLMDSMPRAASCKRRAVKIRSNSLNWANPDDNDGGACVILARLESASHQGDEYLGEALYFT